MASIIQVKGRWRAQVRRAGYKTATKTFDTKRDAEAWARRIETALDQQKPALLAESMMVSTMVQEYRRMRADLGRPIAPESNTHYMLQHLVEDLGDDRINDLTPKRLATWARVRSEQGAGGYTINMELSALGTAIRHTASFMGLQLPDVVGAARPLLHYGQLGGSMPHRIASRSPCARASTSIACRSSGVSRYTSRHRVCP